jgi:hypothetical protein
VTLNTAQVPIPDAAIAGLDPIGATQDWNGRMNDLSFETPARQERAGPQDEV